MEQAMVMRRPGADFIMLAMMIGISRMRAVLDGAKFSGLPAWVGASRAPGQKEIMCLQSAETGPGVTVKPGKPWLIRLPLLHTGK